MPFYIGSTFKVRFPKDPSEVILSNGAGDATARYGAGRWISIQLLTAANAGLAPREGARPRPGALTYSDLPRILHMNTSEDAEPKNGEDLRIWRAALTSKHHAFSNSTEMFVAERGPMAAYISNGGVAGTSGTAWIVHRQLKDSILFVQAKGFSFDDLRRVVGSIDALRE